MIRRSIDLLAVNLLIQLLTCYTKMAYYLFSIVPLYFIYNCVSWILSYLAMSQNSALQKEPEEDNKKLKKSKARM